MQSKIFSAQLLLVTIFLNFNLKPQLDSFLLKMLDRVSQNQLCKYKHMNPYFVLRLDTKCDKNNGSLVLEQYFVKVSSI
jgi:hypothetical protein